MHKLISAAVATAVVVSVAPAAHAAAAAPSTITGFRMATQPWGEFTVSGKLNATGASVAGKPLVLEYSAKKNAAWKRYPLQKGQKALKTAADGAFSGKYFIGFGGTRTKPVSIGVAHGYWRVRFAGDTTVKAATSAVVFDPRVDTRITGWSTKTRKVRKGSYVTFTGTLQVQSGSSWKPFKGQTIWLMGRYKGDKTWYWYAKPKTSSKGYFKTRFKVSRDTYFGPLFDGKTKYYSANTFTTFVDVR